MRFFLITVLSLFGFMAQAGFQGYQSTTNLGLFQAIRCSTGTTCSKQGDILNVVSSGLGASVAATATTILNSQCGSTFYNAGAIVINLPTLTTALIGCKITFVTLNASNFDVNPDNAATIIPTANAAGDAIRNATLGNSITLQAVSATQWAVVSVQGTYTDIN